MSIVETLRRLVDPIAHREVQAERERDRRLARRIDVADGDEGGRASATPPTTWYACRVCGHRSRDDAYCPTCLADTMRVETPTIDGAPGAPDSDDACATIGSASSDE